MRGPGGGMMMAGLVMVETMEVGLQTLSKAALKKGSNLYSFALYSYAIGTLFLLPLLLTFHRMTSPPPKLTFSVICKAFVLGLICCCLQFSSLSGIGFASPTLASAMNNLVPAYTFLLAILIRMEKLNLKARSSQAKFTGTMVSVTGAFVVALYRGPSINFFTSSSSPAPSSSSRSTKLYDTLLSPPSSWSIGGVVLAVASFLKALLYVCQAWSVKAYPAELMLTFISSIFSTIISGILFLVAKNDPNAWKLSSKTELIAVTCYGIYGVAVKGSIHMWALRWKGPIFVAMFKPLGIVIAMVAGVLFLGDKLHLGSIIGGAIIAFGFYIVMWGKAREEKAEEDNKKMSSLGVDSSSPKALLLQKDEA